RICFSCVVCNECFSSSPCPPCPPWCNPLLRVPCGPFSFCRQPSALNVSLFLPCVLCVLCGALFSSSWSVVQASLLPCVLRAAVLFLLSCALRGESFSVRRALRIHRDPVASRPYAPAPPRPFSLPLRTRADGRPSSSARASGRSRSRSHRTARRSSSRVRAC